MEVVEIISYLVNPKTDLLEVSFRLMGDSEDMIREDKIDYSVAEEYGYTLEDDESFDFFVYEDEDEDSLFEDDSDDETIIDEDQLMSFLNEYYTVNPNRLPKPEIF